MMHTATRDVSPASIDVLRHVNDVDVGVREFSRAGIYCLISNKPESEFRFRLAPPLPSSKKCRGIQRIFPKIGIGVRTHTKELFSEVHKILRSRKVAFVTSRGTKTPKTDTVSFLGVYAPKNGTLLPAGKTRGYFGLVPPCSTF